MTLIELLFFLLASFLSYRFGGYFVAEIGWWGVFPAVVLGFGLVGGLLFIFDRLLDYRDRGARIK